MKSSAYETADTLTAISRKVEGGMDVYVKYNRIHIEQRPRYNPNPFHHDNFYYNKDEDYYVCPLGHLMTRIGTLHSKTASGYRSENAR